MESNWRIVLLLFSLSFTNGIEEEVTEQSISWDDVTAEPETGLDYLRGGREPADKKYESPDEMYRDALHNILRLFWSEKCHISEIKFQHDKMNATVDKRIIEGFDKAKELMGECADEILDILRDNITSSERLEPIEQKIIDEIGIIFKDARHHFNEQKESENAIKQMNIIRKEIQLAEDQLHEGWGVVKEMIKNCSSSTWPQVG